MVTQDTTLKIPNGLSMHVATTKDHEYLLKLHYFEILEHISSTDLTLKVYTMLCTENCTRYLDV